MRCLLLLLVVLFSQQASACAADPKAVVQDIFSKAAVAEISADRAKQNEVSDCVDFTALARSALGPEHKKLAAKDFEWFRDTLRDIITLTVYPKAPDFLKGVVITYSGVELSDAKAEVHSSVQNKADMTDVDYSLSKATDGSWRVVDITLSGNRWSEVIHDEVSDVIKRKKWKGLQEAMSKRLQELKKSDKT